MLTLANRKIFAAAAEGPLSALGILLQGAVGAAHVWIRMFVKDPTDLRQANLKLLDNAVKIGVVIKARQPVRRAQVKHRHHQEIINASLDNAFLD